MPIGARQCNSNIQDSSSLLRLAVMALSNFGVHHSSTGYSNSVWLCPLLLKWRDTGVPCPSFCAEALCSYILFQHITSMLNKNLGFGKECIPRRDMVEA